MRVQAFRAWFTSALTQGMGAARRAGLAISRGIKRAAAKIDISTGVGEDESKFGQSGSRAWLQMLEEAKARLLLLFEKSYFERFPRFEKFVRRILGRPVALKKEAPKLAPPSKGPVKLGAHTPQRSSDAERLRREVQIGMLRAHTHEHAGLRDKVETHRRGPVSGDEDRDEERERREHRENDDDDERDNEANADARAPRRHS